MYRAAEDNGFTGRKNGDLIEGGLRLARNDFALSGRCRRGSADRCEKKFAH